MNEIIAAYRILSVEASGVNITFEDLSPLLVLMLGYLNRFAVIDTLAAMVEFESDVTGFLLDEPIRLRHYLPVLPKPLDPRSPQPISSTCSNSG